jgi:hypothetical protein
MFPEHATRNGNCRTPIAELDLPKRARNALLRAGIQTLDEATEWSDRDHLSLPHIGRASVASLHAHVVRVAEDSPSMNLPLDNDAGRFGRTARDPSADMRSVMRLIEDRLDAIREAVPARCRPHFAEALLYVALTRTED